MQIKRSNTSNVVPFRARASVILLSLCIMASAQAVESLTKDCNDCHGKDGVSTNDDIPTIAGLSETVISDMMFAYIDKTRPARTSKYRHGDTERAETDMAKIATALTEDDIAKLAAHYANLSFVVAKQPFNQSLVKKGEKLHDLHCVKCHEDGGSSADDDSGILAGQWTPYLKQAFDDYRSGKRQTEEEMLDKVKELSDNEIAALLSYYASQQ